MELLARRRKKIPLRHKKFCPPRNLWIGTTDTSKLQISASLNYNISLTSSVEYRCLRILELLTLETRFLQADLIEVFKILRGFENLDPDRFFQVIGDGARRGTVLNCLRRGIVWTWGSSSLLAWFVRSGTGRGMGLWDTETLNWIILFFNLNVAMHTSISCVAISNHMYYESTVDTWVAF